MVVAHSVVSDCFWLHGLQHTKVPCPSLSPRVCSNSCPLSRWCHPTILSCHLLLLPSVFPSIRVFPSESALHISWPKYWSFSFSTSPSNENSGLISFRTDLVWSPYCPRDSQESSSTPQSETINSSVLSFLYSPTLTSIHEIVLTRQDLCWQSDISVFNMLSRFVIAFLPRSKHLF